MNKYDGLKLSNQLCFPLYACSREIIKKYNTPLKDIDLTYPQYITMMVLWEVEEISVKELGNKLYLNSGTLTPLLKNLEAKGFLSRQRSTEDERILIVSLTDKGKDLKEKAVEIPTQIASCVNLTPNESAELYRLLYKLMGKE